MVLRGGGDALLVFEGEHSSRSGQVVSQYGRLSAATDRLSRLFHRLSSRSCELQLLAGYTADADIDSAAVGELLSEGKVFAGAAQNQTAPEQ